MHAYLSKHKSKKQTQDLYHKHFTAVKIPYSFSLSTLV
jgi:hypothetical protein